MIICNVNSFKLAFKIFCLSVTAVMIVYWIAKYLKDEDISVLEYKLVKNMETVFHPELTICFENPFIESKRAARATAARAAVCRGTGTGGKKTLPPPVMLVAGCLGGTSI